MSAGDDLLAPRTTQYCEVMAWVSDTLQRSICGTWHSRRSQQCDCVCCRCTLWVRVGFQLLLKLACCPGRPTPPLLPCPCLQVHADDHKVDQQRISFTRPDGSHGGITVSQTHMAYRLTANTAVGATAASVTDRECICLAGGALLFG